MAHQSAHIPNLLIVPAESILLHEDVDLRRVGPLIDRLYADGCLKNPPVAAPIAGPAGCVGRFVILDGANRTTALWKLQVPHHLIQVVDYHEVELDTWGHLVTGIPRPMFTRTLAEAGLELKPTTHQDACSLLARRQIAASIANPCEEVFAVLGDGTLISETHVLHRLAAVYNGHAVIHRVKSDHMAELLPHYDDVTALIRFPRYTPYEILRMVDDGYKLPTGITRHVIQQRALRVNLPLSVLTDEQLTTEEKNRWLHDWINEKLARHEVRYYQESAFLFDE